MYGRCGSAVAEAMMKIMANRVILNIMAVALKLVEFFAVRWSIEDVYDVM